MAAGGAVVLASQFLIVGLWIIWAVAVRFDNLSLLAIGAYSAVVTTVMAFVIQNGQNRGDAALHAKLDALIHYLDVPNDYQDLDGEDVEHIEAVRDEIRDTPTAGTEHNMAGLGGKPSKGTPADKRLKPNKTVAPKPPMAPKSPKR